MHSRYKIYAQSVQNLCTVGTKSMHNRCKIYAQSVQNLCTVGTKSMHNRYKTYAQSVQNLCTVGTKLMHSRYNTHCSFCTEMWRGMSSKFMHRVQWWQKLVLKSGWFHGYFVEFFTFLSYTFDKLAVFVLWQPWTTKMFCGLVKNCPGFS